MLRSSCTLKLEAEHVDARFSFGGVASLGKTIDFDELRSVDVQEGGWSIAGGVGYRLKPGVIGNTLGGSSHLIMTYVAKGDSKERKLIFASSDSLDDVREVANRLDAARS